MGNRKLRERFNILISVYEYQSESIYNLFSFSWEMQKLLQYQELWILSSVSKQDSKAVLHCYLCNMTMGLDLFYQIIIKFTCVLGLFWLLELFVWLFFWGVLLRLQVDKYCSRASWEFWVSLRTSTLKQGMMSENLDLFKSMIEPSIPQGHDFIQ